MKPSSLSGNELLGDKLNTLLDTVYDLNDASEGVSDDLEKLIFSTVQQVEEITDKIQDALKQINALEAKARQNEINWLKPETFPSDEEFRRITSQKWGSKRRAYAQALEALK